MKSRVWVLVVIFILSLACVMQADFWYRSSTNASDMASIAQQANHWDAAATYMLANAIYTAAGGVTFMLGQIGLAIVLGLNGLMMVRADSR